jgi:two-component system, sensor histidine kinase and response regulator
MSNFETLNVFLVDDEPGILMGMESILSEYEIFVQNIGVKVNFNISSFEDGESFLNALNESKPDIVLLDCKLPGINGMDILENQLSKRDDILTIVVTAYATLETAIRATKLGAYDFLAKPFTPEELRYTVRKASNNVILTNHTKKLVAEKRQIRFQFISVLAHELKSPLNAVDGYLDIINNRMLGDNIEDYEKMISRSIKRIDGMRKLIHDILDLTKIESGQKKREIDSINLVEIANNAIENSIFKAKEMGVNIELNSPDELFFEGDMGEMQIIFNNLISNGVKYNKQNGNLNILMEKQNGFIVLKVKDSGIGMEKADVDRLFNEFVRIKNSKTKNIEGSGLGLSIVKKLAVQYGGDAICKSVPEQGSLFIITLKVL